MLLGLIGEVALLQLFHERVGSDEGLPVFSQTVRAEVFVDGAALIVYNLVKHVIANQEGFWQSHTEIIGHQLKSCRPSAAVSSIEDNRES